MASREAYRDAPVSETCPDIDKIIAILEDLRTANRGLREWDEEEVAAFQRLNPHDPFL